MSSVLRRASACDVKFYSQAYFKQNNLALQRFQIRNVINFFYTTVSIISV